MHPSTPTPPDFGDLATPGLHGLAAVLRRAKDSPDANAAADWEWLSEELQERPCPHCGEPMQRWETLNRQAQCTVCDQRLHRRDDPEAVLVERELAVRLGHCGVPPAYRHYEQAKWQGKTPPEFAIFVNVPRGFWFIYGDTGRGKTHLAVAAMDRVMLTSPSTWVLFRDVLELIYEMRRVLGAGSEVVAKVLDKSRDCHLLILDDLGAERGTDFEAGLLSELLRYRHAQQKPTIVTSNLTPDQVCELDPKLGSRITTDLTTCLGGRDRRPDRLWARLESRAQGDDRTRRASA